MKLKWKDVSGVVLVGCFLISIGLLFCWIILPLLLLGALIGELKSDNKK